MSFRKRTDSQEALDRLQKEMASRLCPHCNVGVLRAHPESEKVRFQYWLKCSTCGFSVERRPQPA